MIRTLLDVHTSSQGVVHRRAFLRRLGLAAGAAGTVSLSWRDLLLAQAGELRRRGKAMILLWMDGGPSQFETFNPKVGSQYQGPCGSIPTKLPGVHFAEYWPQTAAVADKLAIIRSMKTNELDHFRAIKLTRTGYPITPTIDYPTWGSVVARDRWDPDFDLPAFVRIGKPRIKNRDVSAGVLGTRFESFKVDVPGQLPEEVVPAVAPDVLRRRLALTSRLDEEFAARGADRVVREKREVYDRTQRMILSPLLKSFHLDDEPDALRDAYGRTSFGQGCLLARRLVESGVSFVEVISTGDKNDAGWDTHTRGFEETPRLSAETDPAYATLLKDLQDRGLLEHTLVVWMGEFGRTPKFKPDGGREHYAEGWIACLSGAGVRTGQVIGATDNDGVHVTDRPVAIEDLFQTFCKVLGMNPNDEYITDLQQPIKLVKGGEVISELFA
jgi:hypothetical protein